MIILWISDLDKEKRGVSMLDKLPYKYQNKLKI